MNEKNHVSEVNTIV